jgi:hypothetical protein
VTPPVLLEVAGMAELPAALRAREPGRIGVDQQVVVEAVLPREHGLALAALVWPEKDKCHWIV